MRAIVASGGAFKGGVQVGMIDGLCGIRYLSEGGDSSSNIPSDWSLPWDIGMGVSTGSLQIGCIMGGEYEDVRRLINLWANLKGIEDIMKKRRWGWLRVVPIFKADSLYTFEPMRKLLKDNIPIEKIVQRKRVFMCGYTDMVNLSYHLADAKNPNILQWIEASCSVPGYHEGVLGRYFDGGVRNITPLAAAINAGATEIDVLLASPLQPVPAEVPRTIVGRGMRAVDGLCNEVMRGDLREVALRNKYPRPGDKKIAVRVYMPAKPVNESWSLKPGDFARMYRTGYQLAAHPLTIEAALGETL